MDFVKGLHSFPEGKLIETKVVILKLQPMGRQ